MLKHPMKNSKLEEQNKVYFNQRNSVSLSTEGPRIMDIQVMEFHP
jgi:hypothetical protein